MHAYIISGTDTETIEQKINTFMHEWNVSPFDIITIEKEEEKKEISIKQIREMTKQLFLTPTQGLFTVAVIKEAHCMTIAAQNAILKILEEPPAKVKILLTSKTPEALLQTIGSRCEKITIPAKRNKNNDISLPLETLFGFFNGSVTQTLAYIDTVSTTPQSSRDFVDNALDVLHTAISTGNTAGYGLKKCAGLAEILLKTRMQLLSNVNQKLALDSAFLDRNNN